MNIEVVADGKSYKYKNADEPYTNYFGNLVIKVGNKIAATFHNWTLWREIEA